MPDFELDDMCCLLKKEIVNKEDHRDLGMQLKMAMQFWISLMEQISGSDLLLGKNK